MRHGAISQDDHARTMAALARACSGHHPMDAAGPGDPDMRGARYGGRAALALRAGIPSILVLVAVTTGVVRV